MNHFLLLDFTSSSRVESFHHPLIFSNPQIFLSAKHILWLKKGCELCNGPNSFLSDLVLKVTPFWCHFQAWFWSFYNNSSCFWVRVEKVRNDRKKVISLVCCISRYILRILLRLHFLYFLEAIWCDSFMVFIQKYIEDCESWFLHVISDDFISGNVMVLAVRKIYFALYPLQ